MYSTVSVVVDRLGTRTHATSVPLALVYDSISWLSLVEPSAAVNRMSSPSAWAFAARSVSARLISTGKSVSDEATLVWSIVMALRYGHDALYQPLLPPELAVSAPTARNVAGA